ncbi:MAG TPA: tail fiber domain-containing protein [Thermoanaerobaculia bacterium]|nr:tail fiber domain-containing protein [Thermoanaerobaculia bacterium]
MNPAILAPFMVLFTLEAAIPEAAEIRNWTAPPYWTPPAAEAGERPEASGEHGRTVQGRTALAGGPTALPFIALPPCRVIDTRGNAPLTGGFLPAATVRSYTVTGVCGIPVGAQALSLNATVVKPTGSGFLVLYPQGGTFPPVSTLNFLGNDVIVNAAVVPISVSGGISMALGVSGGDVILDVNGYYAPTPSVTSVNGVTGDVTLATTKGLDVGLSGSTLTLEPDTAYLQQRVSGSCPAGSSIRAIATDGSVACQVDGPANAFVQGGNAFGATAVLGTTDGQALELKASGSRVVRYEGSNVIAGNPENAVASGVQSATIAGGGLPAPPPNSGVLDGPNRVTDNYGTVGGGDGNRAGDDAGLTGDAAWATVGGGLANTAAGMWSTVGGGGRNAAGAAATVAGGYNSSATGYGAAIGGGTLNTASNYYSTVGGGGNNAASGWYATVPGGSNNAAAGRNSFAAGFGAKANADGVVLFADNTIGDFVGSNPNVFAVAFTGGIGMWTSKSFATGCYIAAGGGSWTCTSSREEKEDFVPVDGRAVLAKVAALPISEWRYRSEASGARHLGPMAQDFRAAFGLGDRDTGIGLIDEAGIALAAIQGLNAKLAEREAEIEALKARLARLEALLVRSSR